MKLTIVTVIAIITLSILVSAAQAQTGGLVREVTVISFPVNRTIDVPLQPNAGFLSVGAVAKIDTQSGGGAEVKINVKKIPSALDIGGIYTTYVAWAISSDGVPQQLGRIESPNKGVRDVDVKLSTPLNTFGIVITAEPHHRVRRPSRTVILESIKPINKEAAYVQTSVVRYELSQNDYFRTLPPPDPKDKAARKIPLALLGARNGVTLARLAGAENEAPDEYNQAEIDLQQLNGMWSGKADEKAIDLLADKVIDLASGAEKKSEEQRSKQTKQIEKDKSTAEFNNTKEELQASKRLVEELKEKNARLESDLGRLQRDYEAKRQLSDFTQLENEKLKGESDKIKQGLARAEVENNFLKQQIAFFSEVDILEKFFAQYGAVRREGYSLTVVLPEKIWYDPA